jgi:preprotein translocase subunit SecF
MSARRTGSVWHRLYRGETDIDFIGRRRLWFAISGIVLLISVASLVTKGLNYGIEFEGGVEIRAPIAEDGPLGSADEIAVIGAIRDVAEPFGAGDLQVQVTAEDPRTVIVQTKEVADPDRQDRLVEAVAEAAGTNVASTDSQRIGSRWGAEITSKAVRALVVFLVVVTLFITWRFEWKMALGAMVALVHDLTITAGIYSLVGFEVTPSTIIAILTILGYSLYDTVVVFDKVEEDTSTLAATGRQTYQDAANLALNQVFMRSLNTTLATLLPVAALLFIGAGLLGASTLNDLALALFVGLMTGAYSSVFLAVPVLAMLKEREPRYRSVRDKIARDTARERMRPVPVGAGAAGVLAGSEPAKGPSPSRRAATPTSQAARPRAGTKKAKRRKRR